MEERRKRASVVISGMVMIFAIAFGGALMSDHVQGQMATDAQEVQTEQSEQTTVATYQVQTQTTSNEECVGHTNLAVPPHKQQQFIEEHQSLANQIRQNQGIEDTALLYHEMRDQLGLPDEPQTTCE